MMSGEGAWISTKAAEPQSLGLVFAGMGGYAQISVCVQALARRFRAQEPLARCVLHTHEHSSSEMAPLQPRASLFQKRRYSNLARPSHGSKFVRRGVHGPKAPSEKPFRSGLYAGLEL